MTGTSLACLRGLTSLEHLVVHLPACPAAGHASLAGLHSKARLQHMEWQLAAPISRTLMVDAVFEVLASLGSLRYLSAAIDDDRMAPSGADGRASGDGRGPPGRQGVSGGEGDGGGASWAARLRAALPLCNVADQESIVLYNLWDDVMVLC